MPAMLPDGTTTDRSVSDAVVRRDLELGRDPEDGIASDLAAEMRIGQEQAIESGARGGEEE